MLTKWVIGLPICSTWSTNYNTVRFLSTLAWFLDVTIFFDAGLIPPVLENVPDNIKAILLDSFTHWSHHPPQQVPYRCLGAHLEEQWYLVAVLMVFLDCLWMIGLFYAQWSYWIRQSQSDKTVFALGRSHTTDVMLKTAARNSGVQPSVYRAWLTFAPFRTRYWVAVQWKTFSLEFWLKKWLEIPFRFCDMSKLPIF